ncbi:hypothetical protein [Sulfurimonas sp. CS5]|uniref:hypothetical protein n=1 Tax=Sulfurimonas sp. CS5 TaxID=3391145 RepID=UPI0039EACDC1
MPKHWTAEERNTLKDLLTNGVELSTLHVALPHRTALAISREATKLNFCTKSVNGVKVLYDDIKRRNRVAKLTKSEAKKKNEEVEADGIITTTNSDAPATVESLKNKSTVIVAIHDLISNVTGLNANTTAVKMLQDYNLEVEPRIVFELSQHILQSTKKDIT